MVDIQLQNGDRVFCRPEDLNEHQQEYANRPGTLTDVYGGYGRLHFDDTRKLSPKLFLRRFTLYRDPPPSSFSITLTFLSIDDAIRAGEHLAPTYGPCKIEVSDVRLAQIQGR